MCPAATDGGSDGLNQGRHAGRICWAVTGTLCGGEIQGTFAQKQLACLSCSFFHQVKAEEGERFQLLREPQSLEQVLRESEARYRAMFLSLPVGVYRCAPDGTILEVNPSLAELLGDPDRDSLVGASALERFATDADRKRWRAHRAGPEEVRTFEVQLRRCDGSLVWVRITSRAIRDRAGGVLYHEGVVEDITPQKEAQAQLELYSEELEQRVQERTAELQRVSDEAEIARTTAEAANLAKSRFLANMSHELHAPLKAILGYSELVREEAEELGAAELAKDCGQIHAAGARLLALINDVLDLARIEEGRMELFLETIQVARMVEDVATTVQPLADQGSNLLEVDCAGDVGELHADLTKVRQTLFNLLSNACRFTHEGHVQLRVHRLGGGIDGSEDWIEFQVRDTGIGMNPQQVGRLFRPITQGKSTAAWRFGGCGLSLALSRHYCRMMGGDILVHSEEGAGSSFTVRLPARVHPSVPGRRHRADV